MEDIKNKFFNIPQTQNQQYIYSFLTNLQNELELNGKGYELFLTIIDTDLIPVKYKENIKELLNKQHTSLQVKDKEKYGIEIYRLIILINLENNINDELIAYINNIYHYDINFLKKLEEYLRYNYSYNDYLVKNTVHDYIKQYNYTKIHINTSSREKTKYRMDDGTFSYINFINYMLYEHKMNFNNIVNVSLYDILKKTHPEIEDSLYYSLIINAKGDSYINFFKTENDINSYLYHTFNTHYGERYEYISKKPRRKNKWIDKKPKTVKNKYIYYDKDIDLIMIKGKDNDYKNVINEKLDKYLNKYCFFKFTFHYEYFESSNLFHPYFSINNKLYKPVPIPIDNINFDNYYDDDEQINNLKIKLTEYLSEINTNVILTDNDLLYYTFLYYYITHLYNLYMYNDNNLQFGLFIFIFYFEMLKNIIELYIETKQKYLKYKIKYLLMKKYIS